MPRRLMATAALAGIIAALCLSLTSMSAASAASPPEIRTHERNRVPACVTPEALTAFLRSRNDALPARFSTIAEHYRDLGEGWRVRWDYAFFQMLLETNYLQFRRGNGEPGDVNASQNNFAGIGATGGGVPGDRFPDARTGVLAQMQHLVAYSGEKVAQPVATRTRERQQDIIHLSLKLGRPVTFADLAKRWAVDKNYATNIETVADLFRRAHCTDTSAASAAANAAPRTPDRKVRDPKQHVVAQTATRTTHASPTAARCQLFTASYGGDRVQLVSAQDGDLLRITALTVRSAEAEAMSLAFIRSHAPGGAVLGSYPTVEDALVAGRRLCPPGPPSGQ